MPLTAKLYEPLWRKRSLSIITSREFNVERELKLMSEWLELSEGQRVLDAACSAGLYARTLLKAETSLDMHALDFSLPFLKTAQSYAQKEQLSMTFVQADVQASPYEDSVFDAIVCGGSLNEFLDLEQAITEFARVLKPKGKMWQMYIKKSAGLFGKSLQATLRLSGIRFIDSQNLDELCSSVNLKLLKAQHRGPVVMALYESVKT